MFNSIKSIVLVTSLVGISSLYAQTGKNISTHIFEKESGFISYDISGGGVITPETNLSIDGEAKLYFKDWGEERIEKESSKIVTTGSLKHKQIIKSLYKETKDEITTVDYQNSQLLQRKITKDDNKDDEIDCLAKTGTQSVAGIVCDVWEGAGVKKCIYKDIVLKLEINIQNISYSKVATSIEFDINSSSSFKDIEMPDYPVHEFALIKNTLNIPHSTKTENFCMILKNISEDADKAENIQNQNRVDFIKYITQNIYKKQKKILPELLDAMKKTRECLQVGEDPLNANECIKSFNNLKAQLATKKSDYIVLWNEKRKSELLDKIEEEIIDLESKISCVNRAKNIMDLSKCMK